MSRRPSRLLTFAEASEIAGVHRATIYRWATPLRGYRGQILQVERIAGRVLVRERVLLDFLKHANKLPAGVRRV